MSTRKYDDASWHYEGEYPKNLPIEHASIFIGMFLTWCIERNLVSEELLEDEQETINLIKSNKATGATLLWDALDGKLTEEELNDTGNAFALAYYEYDSDFAKEYCDYCTDFSNAFDKKAKDSGFEYESAYHVEDTLENYLFIKNVIDKRYRQWKSTYNK